MERLWHLLCCAPRSKPARQVCGRKPAQPCDGADVCWQLLQPSTHVPHQLSVLRLSGLALNLRWGGSNRSCLWSPAAGRALGRYSPICNESLCSAVVLRSDACSRTSSLVLLETSDKADLKLAKKSEGDQEEGIVHKTGEAFLLRKPDKMV